jgi:pimeloyl-ACP methyl ester carboxylesterase
MARAWQQIYTSRRSEIAGARLPAVVFCNGTGGTKAGTGAKLGPLFAEHGFVFLSFDYRGWGESDSKLMLTGDMPKPDANGEGHSSCKASPLAA